MVTTNPDSNYGVFLSTYLGTPKDSRILPTLNPRKVVVQTMRTFNGTWIPVRICASVNDNGFGRVDSVYVEYEKRSGKIFPTEYYLMNAQDLKALERKDDTRVRFEDYNFDNKPDLVIYSTLSGEHNTLEDKFIYDASKGEFIYNEMLSQMGNCEIDEQSKTLSSFWSGGMASMIYSYYVYRWDRDSLRSIKTEHQDFDKQIKLFIRKTDELKDTTWITEIDTLYDEEW